MAADSIAFVREAGIVNRRLDCDQHFHASGEQRPVRSAAPGTPISKKVVRGRVVEVRGPFCNAIATSRWSSNARSSAAGLCRTDEDRVGPRRETGTGRAEGSPDSVRLWGPHGLAARTPRVRDWISAD